MQRTGMATEVQALTPAVTAPGHGPQATHAEYESQSNGGTAVLPWLLGVGLTVGFYMLIPYLPVHRDFITRYFCGHWIGYAATSLCFLGIAILTLKSLSLWRESSALKLDLAILSHWSSQATTTERAAAMLEGTTRLPAGLRRTVIVERIGDVCRYVLGRGNSDTLEDHLRYLADLAADRLHASYALVRTITWAIPILGFLGTVIGITMAIANVTPEQLESSLGEVTAGLAVAFDTTALSLTLSMLLVFSTFVVERCEQSILATAEQFGITRLAHCFPPPVQDAGPLAAAEAAAAEQLLQRTEALITWQTSLWQTGLESLRGRWLETAEQQQLQMAAALQQGMAGTLNDHAQQLHEARGEFLAGFQQAAREMSQISTGLQQAAQLQTDGFGRQMEDLWTRMQAESEQIRNEQRVQTEQSVQFLSGAMQTWHSDLANATEAITNQLIELQRQGELLTAITEQESQLTRLQASLQENLQAVRAVEAFEETMHSLNAAVHLLTVRTRHAA